MRGEKGRKGGSCSAAESAEGSPESSGDVAFVPRGSYERVYELPEAVWTGCTERRVAIGKPRWTKA